MARDGDAKRRYGIATYWGRTPDDVEDAHLLARLGGYGSMTELVRAVVDAEIARLRDLHHATLEAARHARRTRAES
jgi:alkylhydroperoxidase family enzyme